nr:Retrovirus-related Pol polyprotein from transposon RE1 [Ipomoea batatas]
MTEPLDSHFVAAKRILPYVKGTLNLGLLYKKPCATFVLNGFVDVDWVGDANDRRSTTEMFNAVDYVVPIRCDNESAIKLAGNPVFHARTKHIDTHYRFVWQKVLTQDLQLKKLRTEDQIADILTKALAMQKAQFSSAACDVQQLTPCLSALTSNTKPSQLCCQRLNQQKPCFCEYLKNPNLKTYVNSHAAKKAIKTCKISIPKC